VNVYLETFAIPDLIRYFNKQESAALIGSGSSIVPAAHTTSHQTTITDQGIQNQKKAETNYKTKLNKTKQDTMVAIS